MLRDDLEGRETEIIRILSSLPEGFVVIGGYAVSALSIHRFSVDCDIVISGKDLENFAEHIRKEGYRKVKTATGFDEIHKSEVEIYVKSVSDTSVSIDLYVKGVASRKTKASWSYEYLYDNSTDAIVSGPRNSAKIIVPAKELLIAMKIHSGRDVDIRDIVMLSEGVNWRDVLKHAGHGEKSILARQLTDIIGKMDEKRFVQSLRATFGLRQNIESLISECRKNLSKLRDEIESK
jgi:hypothetical protein